MGQLFRKLTVTATLMLSVACTVGQTQVPGVAGPSELALSIRLTVSPDSISQDGVSPSTIEVTALDDQGKPKPGLSVRLDMAVPAVPGSACVPLGGHLTPTCVAQDYGTISPRTIVTGTNGKKTAVYTAPPAPPTSVGGSGTTVTIQATPTGSDFQTTNSQFATIRLVTPGVILPPADTPTAKFTFPTPVNLNASILFDASASCPGAADANGNCQPSTSTSIISYSWTFGDGGTGSGRTAAHTFTSVGTFTVRLDVTNDRGVKASTQQTVTTTASAAPTVDFVFSPVPVLVNGTVTFNANASRAAPGHTIVQYSWDFGDGTSGGNAPSVSHIYGTAQTYKVVLTVTDDVGQRGTKEQDVIVLTGNPVPVIQTTLGPAFSGLVTFDAGNTTTFGGATIDNPAGYVWSFGDLSTGTGKTVSHTYFILGSYTVRLTVTDSLGRTATTTVTVIAP